MTKRIGILGGMGPEATNFLFNLIIKLTDAEKDQGHIASIIYNYPQIPDRTSAILGNGVSALPYLLDGVKLLENAGADFIAIACVTAFYYYPEIIKHVKIPVINLPDELLRYVRDRLGSPRKIGLLATKATIQTGFIQNIFNRKGIEVVVPGTDNRELLMQAIYHPIGIKSGFKRQPKRMILKVIHDLMEEHHPDAIIAGCTELPIVLKQKDIDVPLFDPLTILAQESIRIAGGKVKEIN